MIYEDFKRELVNKLEENRPAEVLRFVVGTSRRTNDNKTDVISLIYANFENISPIFYLSDMYKHHIETDASIDWIAERILNSIREEIERDTVFDIKNICSERAGDHLKLRLYNREWNESIEQNCAHYNVQDLMAVPVWEVDMNDESASIVIDRQVQRELLRMTDDEVMMLATQNTMNDRYVLQTVRDKLMSSMDESDMQFADEMFPEEDILYVLSNEQECFGASAILINGNLKRVKDTLKENYFVIPSSIHEVLIVKESKINEPAELKQMLLAVNPSVSKKEQLGENVYRYNGRTLQICNSREEWMKQKEQEARFEQTSAMTQRRVML